MHCSQRVGKSSAARDANHGGASLDRAAARSMNWMASLLHQTTPVSCKELGVLAFFVNSSS